MATNKRDRPIRELSVQLDEFPERTSYVFKNPKEKVRFIKSVEVTVRRSMEYKDYMRFLKRNTDLRRCTVLKGLRTDGGRKYTIEIHHDPFTLFDIVETVINKREALNEPIEPLAIADEVMELHYDGKIGLIHLSITMHQLVHDDKIFIPLQYIYHSYDKFYKEYQPFFNPMVIEKIEAKVDLSLKTDDIISDAVDPLFTYVTIDGFDFPQVPDEWKGILHMESAAISEPDAKPKTTQNVLEG